jgi:hypothetical protein
MPEPMDVIERRAIAMVPICNSVRANNTAVPEIVATASDSRNQDVKKIKVCRRLTARHSVRQNERREKVV